MFALALSHVPHDSPGWFYGAVYVGMIFHVLGGTIAIPAGFAAVTVEKGSRLHRLAGTAFFYGMLSLGGMGAFVGALLGQAVNIGAGTLVVYLIVTAIAAARRHDGIVGFVDKIAFAAILALSATELSWGMRATAASNGMFEGFLPVFYYVFGGITALLAAFDLRVLLRGTLNETQRIARHLGRMCGALFVASASFFLGQQKELPLFLHGSPVLWVLAFAPLAIMAYWLIRVRFAPWRRAAAQA